MITASVLFLGGALNFLFSDLFFPWASKGALFSIRAGFFAALHLAKIDTGLFGCPTVPKKNSCFSSESCAFHWIFLGSSTRHW